MVPKYGTLKYYNIITIKCKNKYEKKLNIEYNYWLLVFRYNRLRINSHLVIVKY